MLRRPCVAAAVLLAACSGSSTKKLAILHTNDEHSHMLGYAPEADDFPAPTTAGSGTIKGGAGRRAVLLKAEKTKAQNAGYDVLTVSAGDNAMGTLEQVAFALQGADYRLMKLLGYDITTFGNHEFDYGPAALAGAVSQAKSSAEGCPVIVASNIVFSGTTADAPLKQLFEEGHADATKPIHRSWVITTPNGLKVGFVGIMGINAAYKAPLKSPTAFSVSPGLSETDVPSALAKLFNDVQQVVDGLRRDDQVDVVIALSHSGVNTNTPASGEDTQIARNVAGIDVIISGHTHTEYPATLETNLRTGRKVLVQQAGRFGDHIGRIQLSVKDGAVTFETDQSALLAVDDTTVPDATIAGFVSAVIGALESNKLAALGNKSFLEYEVSCTLAPNCPALADDPSVVGDLAFKAIGKGTFTVDNSTALKETALERLVADADLKTVEAVVGPTDIGIAASGAVRANLQPSKKGEFSFSDIFSAVPLGGSPANGSVGYPLTRFGIFLAEVKAALEVTAGYAYGDSDFFIVPSGFCFEYDTSRTAFDNSGSALDPTNGRVTKIFISKDHSTPDKLNACETQVYDATNPAILTASGGTGFMVHPLTPFVVTTNLYVATFAYVAGVKLKDPTNSGKTISPTDAIIHRDPAGLSEIKEWEALGSQIRALSAGGDLPASYKSTSGPFRAKCSQSVAGKGPACN